MLKKKKLKNSPQYDMNIECVCCVQCMLTSSNFILFIVKKNRASCLTFYWICIRHISRLCLMFSEIIFFYMLKTVSSQIDCTKNIDEEKFLFNFWYVLILIFNCEWTTLVSVRIRIATYEMLIFVSISFDILICSLKQHTFDKNKIIWQL